MIVSGSLKSLLEHFKPIDFSGSMILFIGRFDNELSPINVALIFCPSSNPEISLSVLP